VRRAWWNDKHVPLDEFLGGAVAHRRGLTACRRHQGAAGHHGALAFEDVEQLAVAGVREGAGRLFTLDDADAVLVVGRHARREHPGGIGFDAVEHRGQILPRLERGRRAWCGRRGGRRGGRRLRESVMAEHEHEGGGKQQAHDQTLSQNAQTHEQRMAEMAQKAEQQAKIRAFNAATAAMGKANQPKKGKPE